MKKFLFLITMFCSNAAFAQQMIKSGIIYSEHPYIGVVTRLAKLYVQVDPDDMAQLYADTAHFYGMTRYSPDTVRMAKLLPPKAKTLAEAKKGWQEVINNWENITMMNTQPSQGLEYNGSTSFTVQSWWVITMVNKKTKKFAQIEMVLFDEFNDAGKISRQLEYYDPTPLMVAAK